MPSCLSHCLMNDIFWLVNWITEYVLSFLLLQLSQPQGLNGSTFSMWFYKNTNNTAHLGESHHFGIPPPFSLKFSLFVSRLLEWFIVRTSKLWPVCQFWAIPLLLDIWFKSWRLILDHCCRIIFHDLWKLHKIQILVFINKN